MELLIPLLVFLALLIAFALLLRRAWGLVVDSRQLGTFRRSVTDLAARIDETLEAITAQIDRAERALQMVEHGCAILAKGGAAYRQVEAETAIKRGYLNVVHAREAIARHAADIEAARPSEELRWLSRRGNAERSREP